MTGIAEQPTESIGETVAWFAGAVSALHESLGALQERLEGEDANDIDNARVYLEATFWKLETVLNRQPEAAPEPEPTHPNAVDWRCPGCGKTARVNLDVLGPLGTIRCTCGRVSTAKTPSGG